MVQIMGEAVVVSYEILAATSLLPIQLLLPTQSVLCFKTLEVSLVSSMIQ